MCYYIYLTTNNINGKQYIGQHKGDINDSYLGSGIAITKAINKYGKANFTKEVLCICKDRQDVDKKERYYIAKYDAVNNNNFYNCQEGGTGGDGWRTCRRWMQTHPEQAKELYQQSGQRLQQWAKNHPKEAQENIKALIDGSRKWREENPDKVKATVERLQEGKEKWRAEHKEEYQAQVDRWRASGSEANSMPIICLTTGEIFPSLCAASRHYPTAYQANITKCLNGQRKSAGKHPDTGEKLVWAKCEDVK